MSRSNTGTAVAGMHVDVQDVVLSLVSGLPQRDRVLIMLHYTERLELHEIAAVLDQPEPEVERELERIRTLVRGRLEIIGV